MIFSIVVIILSVVADQISKYFAVKYLAQIETLPLIKDIFHFTYVENRGAAFGMLSDHRWVFMILSTVGIGLLIFWLVRSKPQSIWERLGLTLIIGGGIGNMIDRVVLGYVVDFIDCRFIDFYVFNVADSCVCVGCALYMLAVIAAEVRSRRAAADSKNDVGLSEQERAEND